MTGEIRNYDAGVTIRRSAALINHPDFEHPLLVDFCRVTADRPHQYDYALYYEGQILRTDFPYTQHPKLEPVSASPGYRHLWRVASGLPTDGRGLFSWLHGSGYYSLAFATSSPSVFVMTRIGANDLSFNLRASPGLLIRQSGQDVAYACILESHGYFDEATETSRQARGKVLSVEIMKLTEDAVVLLLKGTACDWLIGLADEKDSGAWHEIVSAGVTMRWQGHASMQRLK